MAALTFPRDMTTAYQWQVGSEIQLEFFQEHSVTGGGDVHYKDLASPRWRGRFLSENLPKKEATILHTDFSSLQGGLNTFYAHPPQLPVPFEPLAAGHGMTVNNIAALKDEINLANRPAGFDITAGEFISIETANGKRLHRWLESILSIDNSLRAIEPPVSLDVVIGDAVEMVFPLVEMRLVPNTLSLNPVSGDVLFNVSFECIEA